MKSTFETIGIIAALQVEIDDIRQKLENPVTETISGITYTSGMLYGKRVIAAKCGVGKVFAALCAQTMILRFQPDCIINTGVAGGLAPGLSRLDIVIAESVVQHDMDTSAVGDPIGLLDGIGLVHVPCSESIVNALETSAAALSIHCRRGTVATGDQFISSDDARNRIKALFDAAACEMEGGAIGQVCYVNEIPFGVLRSISDSGDEDAAMDFPTFAARAGAQAAAVIDRFINTV